MGTTASTANNNRASSGGGTAPSHFNPLPVWMRRGNSIDDDHVAAAAPAQWVLIKAKTRQHNSNRLVRKNMWFEAKPNASMTIGRSEQCDMVLEDDRCAMVNARIANENNRVCLVAEARMYRLIGMGFKPKSSTAVLTVGMVIKVGSVSLEVTQLCTKEGDNFMQRFDAELQNVPTTTTTETVQVLRRASKESAVTEQSDDEEGGAVEDDATQAIHENEEPAPAVCYICWGGPEDPIAEEELNQVRTKGQSHATAAAAAAGKDLKHEPNPLIRNPCGKCSGSSRYVHLQCILTWIKSSGSGHCSICNGALPQHFSSPPPNIELKVVRHRRGHSWVGNRRFRLSFVDKPFAVIGRDAGCEVRLSDRSVCAEHAKITFNRDDKQFYISDCSSLTGTYVQLLGELPLTNDGEATYVKIGRSTLSLRLSQSKRTSFVRNLMPSSLRG